MDSSTKNSSVVSKCSNAPCGLETHQAVRNIFDLYWLFICVLTISEEQEEGGERFVNVANAPRTPPPSTPEYTPMSPDAQLAHRSDPEHQSPSAEAMDTDSPLSSCGSSLPPPTPMEQDDTESNSDTGSLSPPPSVIHTPPWLRSDDEDDSDYDDDA